MKQRLTAFRRASAAAALWLWRQIDIEDVAIAVAIVLLAYGFSIWWRPGAYLAPAAVLLWLFVPSRYRFVVSPPDGPAKRNARDS